MADHIATAICEGDHWIIDEIDEMAVDFVSGMTRTASRDVHVQVRIV